MDKSNNSSESNIFLNGEITETVADKIVYKLLEFCLLYTSPSPRD